MVVVGLLAPHGVVDQGADLGTLGVGLQVRPARTLRHPEHVVREVFVLVLRGLWVFSQQFGVAGLKGVGNVLEEDQAQADVLVVARIHVPAQLVGGLEQFGFGAQLGGWVW